MVQWPQRVNISPEGLAELEDILVTSYQQILKEINGASSFGVANRKAILKQIDAHLQTMGVNINDFIEEKIPDSYQEGATDAVGQLKDLGATVKVKTGFNAVHTQAINSLVSDTASSFGDAMQGVHRSAQRLLSAATKQQITQNIATGMAQGSTLDTVKKQIKGTLAENGLDSLVDKSGRTWSLDRYAEMLYRTKMVEARNLGMVNRMAENGYDLVQVSAHGAIDVCGKWEGQILSTTGATKEYDGESVYTVDQATRDGLFHPNCRHAVNAIVPDLAADAYGYDKTTKTYVKGQINNVAQQASKQAKQAASTAVNTMVEKATTYQPVFSQKIGAIAKANGYTSVVGSVKTTDRALQKVVNDYASNATNLKDLNRAILLVPDPNQIDAILTNIGQEYHVTRVKNDFTPENTGYKKIIINVKTPAGGGEIQVTTKEYYQASKELGGHKLYNQVRVKQGDFEAALKQMNELYDKANQALVERLKTD